MYIGETSDPTKRLIYHNNGLQRWTKRGVPWQLVAVIPFVEKRSACQEERRLKTCKNKSYLKKYICIHGKKWQT